MKKIIIIISLVFISNVLKSEDSIPEFSGIIEYEIINTDKEFYKHFCHENLTKKVLYYNKGRARIDKYIDDIIVSSTYVYSDSSSYYIVNGCKNRVYEIEPRTNFDPDNVEKTSVKTDICGYQCNALRFQNGKMIFFSKQLPIKNTNILGNSRFDSAPLLKKYLYLKIFDRIDYHGSFIEEATSIKNIYLADSIFELPTNDTTFHSSGFSKLSDVAYDFMNCKNFEQAVKIYSKYLEVDKTDKIARYNRAICNLKIKNNIKACKDLYILKQLSDDDASKLHNALCNCNALKPYYLEELEKSIVKKRYDKSIDIFNIIINCDNNDTSAIYNRAISKFNNQQNIDAFQDLLLAKAKGDNTAQALISKIDKKELSIAYFKLGEKAFLNKNYQESIKYYSIVINSFPNSILALKNRGVAFIKLKDKEKACLDFDRAAKLNDKKSKTLLKKYCKKIP